MQGWGLSVCCGGKAELSSERAGALAVQSPEVGVRVMLKFAGGSKGPDANLPEFIHQADEYRQSGDYHHILRGEYRRRGDAERPYLDDLAAAGRTGFGK